MEDNPVSKKNPKRKRLTKNSAFIADELANFHDRLTADGIPPGIAEHATNGLANLLFDVTRDEMTKPVLLPSAFDGLDKAMKAFIAGLTAQPGPAAPAPAAVETPPAAAAPAKRPPTRKASATKKAPVAKKAPAGRLRGTVPGA